MTCSLVRGSGCSGSELWSRLLIEDGFHGITGATLSKIRRNENKSKYELLEDKMNINFDDFGSKLDQIYKSCYRHNCTKYVTDVLTKNLQKDVLVIRIFKV